MRFTINTAAQRSPEWFKARLGRLTGSRAKDMLATIKSGEAAARRDLRVELVCERATGQSADEGGYINAEMQRGIDLEPIARAAYEIETGLVAVETGFLSHVAHMAGCSLDGQVNNFEGIVELKCPKQATHYGYLKSGVVPATHLPQVLHNLWITGAQWCDFVSFDDRFPVSSQFYRVRVTREQMAAELAEYEKKALAFLAEVQAEYDALITMTKGIRVGAAA